MCREYKSSRYNFKFIYNDNTYIFNSLTCAFCKLSRQEEKALERFQFDENVIKEDFECLPENMKKTLYEAGILVDVRLDEIRKLKYIHNLQRFSNNNALSLTIIPTNACNFRCSYCFEKDTKYSSNSMSEKVMSSIIHYIDRKLSDNGRLDITWFGGEPLVRFDIIEYLQGQINQLVKRKNISLTVSAISNGYLYTKEVSKKMSTLGFNNIQITIDGNKEEHDAHRVLTTGEGTFDKIIYNVINGDPSIRVVIRINIHKENACKIEDFLQYIAHSPLSEMQNVSFYFAIVRDENASHGCISKNCFSIHEYSEEEIRLYRQACSIGLNFTFGIVPMYTSCGGLSPNSFIVEPNGLMKKCYNQVGKENTYIGSIVDDASIENKITEVNESIWYGWDEYNSEKCRNCKILPLCMGGCPYYTLNDDMKNAYGDIDYRCSTYKYNLQNMLEIMADEYEKS